MLCLFVCMRRWRPSPKYWQDVVRWPLANAQLITALFGVLFQGDTPTLDEHGRFVDDDDLHFGASALKKNLELVMKSECGNDFANAWQSRRLVELFGGNQSDAKEAFLHVDPSYPRAEFLTVINYSSNILQMPCHG